MKAKVGSLQLLVRAEVGRFSRLPYSSKGLS